MFALRQVVTLSFRGISRQRRSGFGALEQVNGGNAKTFLR